MKWLAPAKINLSLRVLGRRTDGFHDLETMMVPLTLADELTFGNLGGAGAPGTDFILDCDDPTLPTGPDNLALKAAALIARHAPGRIEPTHITLRKHIPHGAGLGGGSSDAATVLLALNELYRLGLGTPELAALAAELGSDVPFFVYRSAAICRGRGELVEPVRLPRPLALLLLKPPFPVPTPLAYRRWAGSRELPGVPYKAQTMSWGELANDLERPVYEKYLLLAEIKTWLLEQPESVGALMSGSGSTMFALLHDAMTADALARRAREVFGELWTCPCLTSVQPCP